MNSPAHQDGRDAAYRVGRWANVTVPECPHRMGTLEHAEWMEGFGEATRERIYQTFDGGEFG